MQIRAMLVTIMLFAGFLTACQPAPTSPAATKEPSAPPAADAIEQPTEDRQATSTAEAPDASPRDEDLTDEAGQEIEPQSEGASASGAPDIVASVNGEPIPLSDFQMQAFDTQRFFVEQGLDPNSEEGQQRLLALRRQVLEDMINQVLIEQEAAQMGIEVSDEDVQARIDEQIEVVGGQQDFDESLQEAGTTYDEVLEMERAALIGQRVLDVVAGDIPETDEFVHSRHILCETEADCEEALDRLQQGEDFADVAREMSVDTSSSERGGDLDWVGHGMLPSQQVEDAIFALGEGEMSGVVATDFGWHIFEVLERDLEHPLTEAQVYQLKEKRLMDWLAERRAASQIEIYVEDLQPPDDG